MKKRKIFKDGFTLVELLIVIALIAILSVAVLATINPIEQSNKAKDSTVQNDAAEIMNAYERYYTVQNTYPWMDVLTEPVATYNDPWIGTSRMVGAGLCSSTVATAEPKDLCSSFDEQGSLIKRDELKDAFLAKGYTSLSSNDPNYGANNYFVIDKKDATEGNSVFVCYIPRAKANRNNSTVLYKPTVDGTTGFVTALTRVLPTDNTIFNSDGTPKLDFLTLEASLFKCVP